MGIPAYDLERSVIQGKAYTVSTGVNTLGNTEIDYLYVKNPSANKVNLAITHMNFGVDSSSSRLIFRVYCGPTVSADGTALTINNTRLQAVPVVSAMEAFKDPTVTDQGALLAIAILPSDQPSRGMNRLYVLDPGTSVLFTLENSVGSAGSFVDVHWIED